MTCEDAPACGHVECGFGPGVPGYGVEVDGMPYRGEHRERRFFVLTREGDKQLIRVTPELGDPIPDENSVAMWLLNEHGVLTERIMDVTDLVQ